MSQTRETFFTTIGCMDGRCQEPVVEFGRKKFSARFADTVTEAGLVGTLVKKSINQYFLNSLKQKISISLEKHHSKGIIVYGHQECAGNPVSDEQQKNDILKSAEIIRAFVQLFHNKVPVIPVFVRREESSWETEEL